MFHAKISQIGLSAIAGMVVWRNRPIRYLILCGVLLIAAIVVSTSIMVVSFRSRALVESERELKNTSLILAEQISRSFQAVELVQRNVMEKIQSLGIASSEDYARQMSGQDVNLMLKASISGLAHVGAVTLIDAEGKLLNSSRDWPIPATDVTDRDYFKALKYDTQLTSFISLPAHNRRNGEWTVFSARTLKDANGAVAARLAAASGSGPHLDLADSDGVLRAQLGLRSWESPFLDLADDQGVVRAALGAVELQNPESNEQVRRPPCSLVLFDFDGAALWKTPLKQRR
jgi:hypothetical protein